MTSSGTASEDAAPRSADVRRVTKETEVRVHLALGRGGPVSVSTGLPFFDHMISQLGTHGGFALDVSASGDLEVDAHHTVEDVGLALGQALRSALGDKAGARRFASVSVPLDEALCDVALDLSGRPFLLYDVELPPDSGPLGSPSFEPQLAEEFWRAFASEAALTLHVALRYGRNPHHIIECSFKAVARALREAVRVEGGDVPSTKGAL
ncbi:MAG: imidazoleglycerol-phosphate dehydratase HisB [Actinomycetota bacterium]|nr:imidazoleglycerol-phosphate dehydratase HisB [Actinomycetota bacterium]